MLMGKEDQKGPEKMPEKENIKEEKRSKKERRAEGSLGEDLGETKRKIGNMKKKNKGNGLRRGFQKMSDVAKKPNDDTKKKNQSRIFPLQSFTKVPSASKFWI